MLYDLETVPGRREAVLSIVGSVPVTLMDICRALGVDGAPSRARIRSALTYLEKRNEIVQALDDELMPLTSRGHILFCTRHSARTAKEALTGRPISLAKTRTSRRFPRVEREVTSLSTVSIRQARAATILVKSVLPIMDDWKSLNDLADETGLPIEDVRLAIQSGLHSTPRLVAGYSTTAGRHTYRLGARCQYVSAQLCDSLPVPVHVPTPVSHEHITPVQREDPAAMRNRVDAAISEILARRTGKRRTKRLSPGQKGKISRIRSNSDASGEKTISAET